MMGIMPGGCIKIDIWDFIKKTEKGKGKDIKKEGFVIY